MGWAPRAATTVGGVAVSPRAVEPLPQAPGFPSRASLDPSQFRPKRHPARIAY